jgi:hypothetical protein
MENATVLSSDTHPAPHRDMVPATALFLGLFAGPLVWGLQLIINFAVAAHACYPGDTPFIGTPRHSIWAITLFINLLAAALALAGSALSYRHWRATRNEHHGSAGHALEAGEGRTRFLALWGVMTGCGFLLAILFNTLAFFMVPQCLG